MSSFSSIIEVVSVEKTEIIDITPQVNFAVRSSGIRQGIASIMPLHTTTSIRINENEPRLIRDFKSFLECLVPCNSRYFHDEIEKRPVPEDEKINGHSHIKSFILGTGETVPVRENSMMLGKWQSVFFVDFDGPQQRKVLVTVIGDK